MFLAFLPTFTMEKLHIEWSRQFVSIHDHESCMVWIILTVWAWPWDLGSTQAGSQILKPFGGNKGLASLEKTSWDNISGIEFTLPFSKVFFCYFPCSIYMVISPISEARLQGGDSFHPKEDCQIGSVAYGEVDSMPICYRVSVKKTMPFLKLTARTWKWMVGRLVSFWDALFQVLCLL